jgi:hypothetical protein
MRTLLAGLALVVLAAPAVARGDGTVTIALTPDGERLAAELGLDPAELQQRLQDKISDVYDTANVDGFLRSFANATSFASRGVGVDYAPLFHDVELGITANLAAAVEGLDAKSDPAAGVAANVSLLAGLSLARWGHDEMVVYANGFHRSTELDGLSGAITNVGLHGQYHLFYPSRQASTLVILWSGLHVTAGVEVSRWSFHAGQGLDKSFELEGSNGSTTSIDTHATGAFDLSATATTIPIELTTSARILYLAGIYIGAGLDIQMGHADASASLDGAMQGTLPQEDTAVGIGTATIAASGKGSPSPLAFHILTGVELNVWRLKAFAQATVVPIDGVSVGFGLRLKL